MKTIISILFGALLTVVFVLLLAFFFRDPILSLMAGGSKTEVKAIAVERQQAKLTDKQVYAESSSTVWVEGKENRGPFGVIEAKRLIVANGTCQAGIDHTKVEPRFLDKDGQPVTGVKPDETLIVEVGQPEVLNCGVTNARYVDGSGFLPASTDLSNQLYADASRQLRDESVGGDLVTKARVQAEERIELVLRRLGFKDVRVRFVKPSNQPRPAPLPSPAPKASSATYNNQVLVVNNRDGSISAYFFHKPGDTE